MHNIIIMLFPELWKLLNYLLFLFNVHGLRKKMTFLNVADDIPHEESPRYQGYDASPSRFDPASVMHYNIKVRTDTFYLFKWAWTTKLWTHVLSQFCVLSAMLLVRLVLNKYWFINVFFLLKLQDILVDTNALLSI